MTFQYKRMQPSGNLISVATFLDFRHSLTHLPKQKKKVTSQNSTVVILLDCVPTFLELEFVTRGTK